MAPTILVLATALWAAIHSLLATQRAKDAVTGIAGRDFERAYRLAYNGFAVVSFLPILALVRLLPDRVIHSIPAPWLFVMLAGQATAVVLLIAALLQTGALQFVGIEQFLLRPSDTALKTRGFYSLVRHPLYLFGLLFVWLTPVLTVNLLTLFGIITIYLFVGAQFEERRLLREYGEQYAAYKRHTPMILPSLRRSRPAKALPRNQVDG